MHKDSHCDFHCAQGFFNEESTYEQKSINKKYCWQTCPCANDEEEYIETYLCWLKTKQHQQFQTQHEGYKLPKVPNFQWGPTKEERGTLKYFPKNLLYTDQF